MYVGWEEVSVCKEKGRREIHYIMIRKDGGKVLAVIAKEINNNNNSLRNMSYKFLLPFNSAIYSKPTSNRHLSLWLNSLISDSPTPRSPYINDTDGGDLTAMKDAQLGKSEGYTDEFMWLGSSWTCKKLRRHYKAFSRNGMKISVNVFVHVLFDEDERSVAYLDDMYEDTDGNKMVVVRWFHKIDEVGVDLHHSFNDREILFSLSLQDLAIECIEGLAAVLNSQHYAKFVSIAHNTRLEPYLCDRQYDNAEFQPFDITQVKGYWKQNIVKYIDSSSSKPLQKTPLPEDSQKRQVKCDGSETKPRKRLRLSGDYKANVPLPTVKNIIDNDVIGRSKCGFAKGPLVTVSRRVLNVEAPLNVTAVGSVVEVLSLDSGMRGCWFRATVTKKHKNKVKLRYHDVKDAENESNLLEEWVIASRVAVSDVMGLRHHGRATVRPSFPSQRGKVSGEFNIGAVVDAWRHDGWWEGIIIEKHRDGILRVYFPGEKQVGDFASSVLRHSYEWIGNTWIELTERPDVALSILSDLVIKRTAGECGDKKSEPQRCDYKQSPCDVGKKDRSSKLHESSANKNEFVLDLSKDGFLSKLKWKTFGKRTFGKKRTCLSISKLQTRGNYRVNSERVCALKVENDSYKTSKADRDKCKYISGPLFSSLTSLVV